MTSSLSDKALAFEAAVRELSRRYPPPAMPTILTSSFPMIWQNTILAHEELIRSARYGRINDARYWCLRTGIPAGELDAIIALIYG